MGISRKFKRRHQVKQAKQAKKTFKNILTRMNSLGDNCSNCDKKFNRDDEDWSSWMVSVIGDQPHLICPDCHELIKKHVAVMRKEEEIVDVN